MEHNYYHEIYDCVTKETTVIPFTDEEIAALEAKTAELEAERIAKQTAEAEKAAAKAALLAKLGLTEEEINVFLA